ncbi:MAG: ComF family protein [Snowella sp.]|nr:ComF family protein [Snowella sp.]
MFKGLLSLFLKSNCPLCQRPAESTICHDCERKLQASQLRNPLQFWRQDLPLFVWGHYEGQLKRAIAVFKYENHPELGEFFGYNLGENWLKCNLLKKNPQLTVIPVPLHVEKQKERGFNQAELIAKAFCHITRYPLHNEGLVRIRNTDALFNLNPQERQSQIKQAFCLSQGFPQPPRKQPILLVDDIYTTGTTVRECVKVLNAHQFPVLGVVAIASARRS